MLELRGKFVDFGKQLQPPIGYEIDYAVATTYSLDLYALISLPLAMFYSQSLESEISLDNLQLLEAIQNTHKHLKVYCQKGKIQVPKTQSSLLVSFVESCVYEYMPEEAHVSFHPKVWVLRFKEKNGNGILYRCIVMSRNLTFDKSYDIAYWMEGTPGKKSNPKNKELVKFLNVLNNKSSFDNVDFIKDLSKVMFDLKNETGQEDFTDYSFSYFPKDKAREAVGLHEVYTRRLIISPFLDEKIIEKIISVTNKQNPPEIFSRKNELDKVYKKFPKVGDIKYCKAYYFSEEVQDFSLNDKNDDEDSESQNIGIWNNNLHAKIYLRQYGEYCYWDFGSANASQAAFDRNHEFMIHLKTRKKKLFPSLICKDLLKEYNGVQMFHEYEPNEHTTAIDNEIDTRVIEYEFLSLLENLEAKIVSNADKYDLLLSLDLISFCNKYNCSVSCSPLGSNCMKTTILTEVQFSNIPLYQLSSFIEWNISTHNSETIELLTKINIKGMPAARVGDILRSIIDSSDKFLKLLTAILTNEPVKYSCTNHEIKGNSNSKLLNHLTIPLFEEILINLSRNPERIRRLSNMINQIRLTTDDNKKGIIPQEFEVFWKTIFNYIENGRL